MIALRADRLERLRKERGWSQRELARICGFGIVQIHRYESGQGDPAAAHLKILAEKLDVSTDFLVGLSDDPRRREDSREFPDLTDAERDLIETFRRDDWLGVVRLGADRMGGK